MKRIKYQGKIMQRDHVVGHAAADFGQESAILPGPRANRRGVERRLGSATYSTWPGLMSDLECESNYVPEP